MMFAEDKAENLSATAVAPLDEQTAVHRVLRKNSPCLRTRRKLRIRSDRTKGDKRVVGTRCNLSSLNSEPEGRRLKLREIQKI